MEPTRDSKVEVLNHATRNVQVAQQLSEVVENELNNVVVVALPDTIDKESEAYRAYMLEVDRVIDIGLDYKNQAASLLDSAVGMLKKANNLLEEIKKVGDE